MAPQSPFSPAQPQNLLNIGLLLHGTFEALIGFILLIQPSVIFPWIAGKVLYSNQERSLLRWFAFSIVLQGGLAVSAFNFDVNAKRAILTAFLGYHFAIVVDGGYALLLEGAADELALALHTLMTFIIGYTLYAGAGRRKKGGKKM